MSAFPDSAQETLHRCLENGTESDWVDFIRVFQPVVARSVLRVLRRHSANSASLVDDLVQETYMRLCKDNFRALRDFEHRHTDALFAYMRVVATSAALDHFRSLATLKRQGEIADDEATNEAAVSPRVIEDRAHLKQLEAFLASTQSERDCSIFWLYYKQGFTAPEIARIPHLGLTQKGVESCIFRLTQDIRLAMKSARISSARNEGRRPEDTLGVAR
jgi:RNA polymerase sigma-70 factor (ECF subfamily)